MRLATSPKASHVYKVNIINISRIKNVEFDNERDICIKLLLKVILTVGKLMVNKLYLKILVKAGSNVLKVMILI